MTDPNSQNYVGITVGPILNTLALTSSPAGLWCASSVFCWVTEQLCYAIYDNDKSADIISPQFSSKTQPSVDGIGKYPDRIFYSSSLDKEVIKKQLDAVIKLVKKHLFTNICKSVRIPTPDVIEQTADIEINYCIISAALACQKNRNIILSLSSYLDILEINRPLQPKPNDSILLKLFEGTSGGKNYYVKECFLIPPGSNEHNNKLQILNDDGDVKTIVDIAHNKIASGRKIRKYYAVVFADGDGIGTLLRNMPDNNSTKAFSAQCLEYTKAAAELIKEYGGVTIYAGGDDLLLLAPLAGKVGDKDNNSLFRLLEQISAKFVSSINSIIADQQLPVSLVQELHVSFGVSVQYEKHPLYEALASARYQLFEVAKKTKHKNCIAFKMQKASGQISQLLIPLPSQNEEATESMFGFVTGLIDLMDTNTGLKAAATSDGSEELVAASVLYSLELHKELICCCLQENIAVQQLLKNIFDHSAQKMFAAYVSRISSILTYIYSGAYDEYIIKYYRPDADTTTEQDTSVSQYYKALNSLTVLEHMIRTAKFYIEKEGGK